MEGFVGEEEDFVMDAGLDRKPVKLDEVGGDGLMGLVRVRTLAAEFCTYWSLSRALLGTPDRTPLQ